MLRSLVGSEMCIRNRASAAISPRPSKPKRAPDRQASSSSSPGNHQSSVQQETLVRPATSQQWSEDEWLMDSGWQVVGSENDGSTGGKGSKAVPPPLLAKQSQPTTARVLSHQAQNSFAEAFFTEDATPDTETDDRSSREDGIQLIDGAAKARRVSTNNKDKKGKSKSGSRKGSSKGKSSSRRGARAGSQTEVAHSPNELTTCSLRTHCSVPAACPAEGFRELVKELGLTVGYAIAPVLVLVLLYLFIFIL
eukprot:TRINITY_DN28361_c0_g1_i1.p1 TRINITY_DN28361_c0_g1~~TRINITY_DN28361_c0_g1_i1.p1  ORF type:complete len:251 (-),score=61.70 TRINITY_DN28361_c0_g1_i1:386-1138(-)